MRALFTGLFALAAVSLSAQTISEIQGEADASPYLDMEVTTSGIVTASDGLGFFIQDGSGPWSGVYVYDTSQPAIGDAVTVTAMVDEYYELTELVSVSELTIESSGNPLPEPEVLATGDVEQEQWEGVLVQVSGACTNTDLGFGEWELNDGSGACRIDDLFFAFTPVQGTQYAVTGPHTFTYSDYKIGPRNAEDIEIDAPLYFTVLPEEFDLSTTSITLRWQTNAPAETHLEYGLSPIFDLGAITTTDLTTEHEVVLTDLTPATVIYTRMRSVNSEGDTGWSNRVCITVSESSGLIEVLFNQEPDFSVATYSEAPWTPNLTDSIVEYIGQAQTTLDICMYDLNECPSSIIDAINERVNAGVLVRYITDEEPENLPLSDLNPEIPVLAGNTEGIMHDKFILIDRDDALNSWVITGSTNHTGANLGWDFNNHLRIQDQSLCRAYTLEFQEMWGATGSNYNESNAAFASAKTDNTPHKFVVGGKDVELYFSPSDGTTGQIAEHLETADDRIAFAVMAFTENSLGTTLANMHDAIDNVMGVIDYVEFNGSEFDFLVSEGVDVVDYQNEDGSQWPDGPVMHSKYAIVDYGYDDPDPITITGSHNWTASAGSINDENTLIIHDGEIANWFYQDFSGIRNFLGAVSVAEPGAEEAGLLVYPNPSSGAVQVRSAYSGTLMATDVQGRLTWKGEVEKGGSLQLELPAGVYQITLVTANHSASTRLIVR